MPDYATLKAADAALGIADPGAAAAALNAQTETRSGQAFTVHAAKLVAATSANMSWARIRQRAQDTAALPPVSATDAAILAALTITSMDGGQAVDPTSSGWAAWRAGLAALEAVGDLTADDVAAITALTTTTVPTWQPPVTAGDIQTARAIP